MAAGHINGEELRRPDPGIGDDPAKRAQSIRRHKQGAS